ncbi:hypothetical protein LHK_01128 [Laribacter hongkongensis HLHK9]|uniref:Uncharacterized protein n=1 Tax=Laribacter hongkongensis (strain HLHK9) TaxID=557598 RepID=C1D6L4_LARHH|nr:hypothetical protein LHK_01128 [Laribacter hongkongensis HLHK9]
MMNISSPSSREIIWSDMFDLPVMDVLKYFLPVMYMGCLFFLNTVPAALAMKTLLLFVLMPNSFMASWMSRFLSRSCLYFISSDNWLAKTSTDWMFRVSLFVMDSLF